MSPTRRSPVPASTGAPPATPPFDDGMNTGEIRRTWRRADGTDDPPASVPPAPGPTGGLAALLARLSSGGDPAQPSGFTGQLAAVLRQVRGGEPPAAPAPSLVRGTIPARRRLTSADLAPPRYRRPLSTHSLRLPGARRYWWAYLLSGLALTVLVFQLGLALARAVNDQLTTWQYGAIRTSHLATYFGFKGEGPGHPTLLTAVNDAGTVHVFILPAGQSAQALVVEVPLGSDPTGQLPVALDVFDADLDGHPDLLVQPLDGGPPAVFLLDTWMAAVGAAHGAGLHGQALRDAVDAMLIAEERHRRAA